MTITPYGYPGQYYPPPGTVQIGDIQVRDNTVWTPAGSCPLPGSRWSMMDHSIIERRTPTWALVVAIVLTVLFIWTLVGLLFLLFLLVKEDQVSGFVEVMVANEESRFTYRTVIPVTHRMVVPSVHNQMRHVEMMANQPQ
ncbi:MAG: hypothetical protein FWF02_09870 [Micrococcales bacterium]|nr:hypothetical protein [Micrococcales bacterium]MCL2667995.1 hypothetical protein [Micrococcales bacterium]